MSHPSPQAEVTVLCVVRHGHATNAVCLESLYSNTRLRLRVVFVDIASPPPVAAFLEAQARQREDFLVVRIDTFVSRQSARIRGLRHVDTPYVVILDNNMLCTPGCIDTLVDTCRETGAAMVSPIIVSQGGDIHFSAGYVRRRPDLRNLRARAVYRPHHQAGAPVGAPLATTQPRRVEIDFVESHCCLARTECLRLPGILEEELHNAHTMCYAGYKLKREFGRRLILEPSAVASILPIGFGYDLPWMCRSYLRPDWIRLSHQRLIELIGKGPGTDLAPALRWHAKHFKYLVLSMMEGDRLERDDLLAPSEVPEGLVGYDHSLPPDADATISQRFLPFLAQRHPDLVALAEPWLGDGSGLALA